jgi:cobalt/nickel transport system permease protein/cobalt/nickel transport protein
VTRTRTFVLAGLVVALLLGGVVSYYASGDPDGLNKVAEDTGFAGTEAEHAAGGLPLAGYETRGLENERLSGAVAGITGVLVTFALAAGLTLVVRRRSPGTGATGSDAGRNPAGRDPAGLPGERP